MQRDKLQEFPFYTERFPVVWFVRLVGRSQGLWTLTQTAITLQPHHQVFPKLPVVTIGPKCFNELRRKGKSLKAEDVGSES